MNDIPFADILGFKQTNKQQGLDELKTSLKIRFID